MTTDPKNNPTVLTKGTDPDRPIPNPPTPQRDDRNSGDGKGPHYTTWLVVRYQAGDDGSRPLAPGSVFYESPDVWTQGSMGINNPVPGEATQVFARVSNLGMQDATGVTVEYWWANPSIAITEASATKIAADTQAIPAGNALVFQSSVDWTPIVENGGHECLIVQAYIQVFDPLVSPMDPMNDRHVGQKNEQLVLLQQGEKFRVQLDAHNFTREEQRVVVEARRALIPRNFAQTFARRKPWPTTLLDPALTLPVRIEIAEQPVRVAPTARLLAKPLAVDCLPPADAAKTLAFKPGEVRKVTVTGALPPAAIPGEIYVTRVTQRIGNTITGGYTIYATLA